jgi:peptidoglycan/LPS O-acetylase OafA/YrhL
VTKPSTAQYSAPLDGLRALSALAVFGLHATGGRIVGGFLGVDVFFVLSGYLITGLLCDEYDRTGTIDFSRFYVRRARRLLPAMIAMLLVAALLRPQCESGLHASLSVLFYYANWRSLEGSNIAHAWSLSVEEQFYSVWPVLLFGMLGLLRSRRAVITTTIALASASAVGRALFYRTNPLLMGYASTLSRLDELLIGAVLAQLKGPAFTKYTRGCVSTLLAWASGLALVVTVLITTSSDAWLFRGGFVLIALAASAVIAHVRSEPNRAMGRFLAWRPLVQLGKRSYGFYLYHHPIVAAIRPTGRTTSDYVTVALLRIVATFALTWVSYWLIETPFLARNRISGSVVAPLAVMPLESTVEPGETT